MCLYVFACLLFRTQLSSTRPILGECGTGYHAGCQLRMRHVILVPNMQDWYYMATSDVQSPALFCHQAPIVYSVSSWQYRIPYMRLHLSFVCLACNPLFPTPPYANETPIMTFHTDPNRPNQSTCLKLERPTTVRLALSRCHFHPSTPPPLSSPNKPRHRPCPEFLICQKQNAYHPTAQAIART